mmetsp:Transcript_28927/g.45828  ORF Transcript_28927/g.45828 Transcript_28927/m.45828 type:complete len:230 (-) Transcript_28927:346-1035(-)
MARQHHHRHVLDQHVFQRYIEVTDCHLIMQDVDTAAYLIRHSFANFLPFAHRQRAGANIFVCLQHEAEQRGACVLHHQQVIMCVFEEVDIARHILLQSMLHSVHGQIAQDVRLRHNVLVDVHCRLIDNAFARSMQRFICYLDHDILVETIPARSTPYRSLQRFREVVCMRNVVAFERHCLFHVVCARFRVAVHDELCWLTSRLLLLWRCRWLYTCWWWLLPLLLGHVDG